MELGLNVAESKCRHTRQQDNIHERRINYPMSSSTERRVVVITGANEGIGYHMLTTLFEKGYRVAGLDINGEHIQSLQETHPGQVWYFECDVTADDDVRTAIDEIPD